MTSLDSIDDASENESRYLKQYLECEALLGEFFGKVNYCRTHCINQKHSLYEPMTLKGEVGCCGRDYDELCSGSAVACLEKERIDKYGLPESNEGILNPRGEPLCRYHTQEGCILKDHKSTVCVAFICREHSKFLREKFNIGYKWNNTRIILSDILEGNFDESQLNSFKSEIKGFIEKVK